MAGFDRERLAAMFGRSKAGPPASPVPAPAGEGDALREHLRRRLEAQRGRQRVELPPGEEAENEHGRYWRRLLRYPLPFRHGQAPLEAALRLDGARLSQLAKDEAFAATEPGSCLFFDTETTGLSGGAGTVVFNIGLGWFEEGAFVVEQTFLRDFGEEKAMLHGFQQRLAERPLPVSYVGKSFDRHRIAARLLVHKMPAPIQTGRHLDLYYLARRAYGKALPNCRLRTVEEERLGLSRRDDLPGSEAPVAFLQWLRDGSGPVDRVLEHNRLDVLSVAALLGALAGRQG